MKKKLRGIDQRMDERRIKNVVGFHVRISISPPCDACQAHKKQGARMKMHQPKKDARYGQCGVWTVNFRLFFLNKVRRYKN